MLVWPWIRKNLLSTWTDAIISLALIAFLIKITPYLVSWFFLHAVWSGGPEACRAAHGACWAMIHEKYRLILFGYYPYDQQWRPLIGMVIFITMIIVSCIRRFWHYSLLILWALALVMWFLIMRGGILGLSYVPNKQWGGLPLTMMLTLLGMIFAFPFSILLAIGRRSTMAFVRLVCVLYIELIRGVPLIAMLFMAIYLIPLFFYTGFSIEQLLRAQIAIILFSAAYLAEAIRGGLQAVPLGQYEASISLGLKYRHMMTIIILPQALKISIPSIVSVLMALFKDTSLVAIIGLSDLLFSLRQAISDPVWQIYFVEGYIFVAVIYFGFCFFISKYSQNLEKKLSTERK